MSIGLKPSSLSTFLLLHLLVSGLLVLSISTEKSSLSSRWKLPSYESDWTSVTATEESCIELTTLDCTG